MYTLLLLVCVLSVSWAALLTCNHGSCPRSVVSCECSEAAGSLQWTISSPGPDASELCESERYRVVSEVGAVAMPCGPAYAVVLDAIDRRNPFSFLRSTLSFTANVSVVVTCADALGRNTTTIQAISKYRASNCNRMHA